MKNYSLNPDAKLNLKPQKFLNAIDVILMEGNGNYTWVYLANGTKRLYSKTMNCMSEEFQTTDFLRIHKSYSINVNHIQSRDESNELTLILTNGLKAEVSRRKKKEFLPIINLLSNYYK
jgi:two-component system, LytTR family, response regulator